MSQHNSILGVALALLPPELSDLAKDFSSYTLAWLPIAGLGANVRATFQTQGEGMFIATHISRYVTSTASPPVEDTSPQYTIDMKVGDRSFFPSVDLPHLGNLVPSGDSAGGPAELPFPIIVPGATNFLALLTALETASQNVRITLSGFTVYNRGSRGTARSTGFGEGT